MDSQRGGRGEARTVFVLTTKKESSKREVDERLTTKGTKEEKGPGAAMVGQGVAVMVAVRARSRRTER